MTKFIAVCDVTQRSRSNRFAGRFVDNLETHFGFVKSFECRQIRWIKDQRYHATHMFISSIVALPVGDLFGTEVGTVRDGRLSWYNFGALVNSWTVFDWSRALEANDKCLDGLHEFLVIDTDIEDVFWEEARLLSLSDIVPVLDDYVSLGSDLIEFTHPALECIKGSRFGVVFYSENDEAQALDIYCQFENFVSYLGQEGTFFLGHLPKYSKYCNYSTLETIGLQNIVLSLLNLNYQPILNNMLSEMFKGSLH